jgi:hypothetical protein
MKTFCMIVLLTLVAAPAFAQMDVPDLPFESVPFLKITPDRNLDEVLAVATCVDFAPLKNWDNQDLCRVVLWDAHSRKLRLKGFRTWGISERVTAFSCILSPLGLLAPPTYFWRQRNGLGLCKPRRPRQIGNTPLPNRRNRPLQGIWPTYLSSDSTATLHHIA